MKSLKHPFAMAAICLSLTAVLAPAQAESIELVSPGGKTLVTIDVSQSITYSVNFNSVNVLKPSALSMTLEKRIKHQERTGLL